ncbi:MAG: hypothetical protein LBC88_09655 [Spirochaetaceae bacterium]|nr:hypothetical protein [Spirochaetaceae bacterium]
MDHAISPATLPTPLPVYAPRSGTNKATVGAITSDADNFMSALEFSRLNLTSSFAFAGIDEWGLNVGYGGKFGGLYLGVSYGGSLIDELYRRLTNQQVNALYKKDTVTTTGTPAITATDSEVVDGQEIRLLGQNVTTNTLQVLVGAGPFGLKIGFALYLDSYEADKRSIFESSLKPLMEMGFNFRAGPVGIKFAVRGAFDIHQYNTQSLSTFSYIDTANFGNSKTGDQYVERRLDYTEPSGGITLGFDFGNGTTTRAEFDIIADGGLRMYKNNDEDGVTGAWGLRDGTSTTGPFFPPETGTNTYTPVQTLQYWGITASDVFDLRLVANPTFIYSADLNEQFSMGVKFNVGGGYNMLTVEQELLESQGSDSITSYSGSSTTLAITPELGAGVSFRLLPNRFAVHAGFGVQLFSYRETKTEIERTLTGSLFTTPGTETSTVTARIMGLPNARFAAGFTLNFTAAAAMDLLAVSKNLNIDETKLTVLFTIKR